MKYTCLFLSILVLFYGCTIFGERVPLEVKNFNVERINDQILLTAGFSGNDIPKEVLAHLTILDKKGEPVYDKDFYLKEIDFHNNGSVYLEKYFLINSGNNDRDDDYIEYANFTLLLPNKTFSGEIGNKSILKNAEYKVEVISHETQYALIIKFLDRNKKQIAKSGNLEISIIDDEGILYKTKKLITVTEFKGGHLLFLIPYSNVNKSFYKKGNVLVTFLEQAQNLEQQQKFEKRLEIDLKSFTEKEKAIQEEDDYLKNARILNNTITYVGFEFVLKNAGYIYLHTPDRVKMVRFDVILKNSLNKPQYLIKNDFYMKDSEKIFYPVLSTKTTQFGPLLKPGQRINASFYFNIIKDKSYYVFYYGDKILANSSLN